MITKDLIARGLDEGIIRFVIDPNMEHGTVCQIGEYWFYFGGSTAEELNPAEYLSAVAKCELAQEVYETLESFRKDGAELADVYRYYEAYLNERIGDRKLWMRLGVVLNITPKEADVILGDNEDAACEAIQHVIETGRFRAEGDSYIPEETIRNFNQTYGTNYKGADIGFDM